MSNQDQDPNRPSRPPASFPPQPYQLIDENNNFTPYYVKPGEAKHFPGHVTPHLSNGLKHPAEYFAEPRNQFPGTDPIMDVRMGDGEKPGQLSYEQVAALKDVKDMSIVQRHARDAKEFSDSPPKALPHAQKQRWAELFTELFQTKEDQEEEKKDPFKIRPRGELRKLKELAALAGGKQE